MSVPLPSKPMLPPSSDGTVSASDDSTAPIPHQWVPTGDYATDRAFLVNFVKSHLEHGKDIGPVRQGKSGQFMLLQPGADKLANLFNL